MKLRHCIAFPTIILAMSACEDIPDTVEITEQRELCKFDEGETYRLNFNFLQATQPLEWRRMPDMQFRDLNYSAGTNVEIAVLGEASGTVLDNFNRWVTEQFNLPAMMGLSTCSRVEMLGKSGYLLELTGTYNNKSNQALIGAIVEKDNGALMTVKMTGNKDEVMAEKERFIKFLTTIKNTKWKEAK